MRKTKQCISCGKVMSEEEAKEHEQSNDCPSIDIVYCGVI